MPHEVWQENFTMNNASSDTLTAATRDVETKGFLDIELDPSLDLFAEIEKPKKEKNVEAIHELPEEKPVKPARIATQSVAGGEKKTKKKE